MGVEAKEKPLGGEKPRQGLPGGSKAHWPLWQKAGPFKCELDFSRLNGKHTHPQKKSGL